MASPSLSTAARLLPRHDTSSFTAAEMAEMLVDPYDEAPKYSKAIVGVVCGLILLFGVGNLVAGWVRTKHGKRIAKSRTYRRAVAAYRWIETSQPKAMGWMRFPTWGTIGLIAAFFVFCLVWMFSIQPYYRSRWNVGSPPLAIRTGMAALGLFPFILVLGSKWNLVGFVVGCSHEKLQVYHQWASHLFLILSLLHTFPFVVQGTHELRPNTDGLNPHGYSQLYYSWHVSHKVYYWSGIAALVPLAWLCWGSFTPIRNKFYELWKALHIVSAILFSAFFYIHCNQLLTSWHYLWSAAAVYLSCVAMRWGLLLVRNGSHIATGRVEALPDNAVRVTIRLPRGSPHRWEAGQHFFVNFVKILPLESHPYTVSNAPYADRSSVTTPDRLLLIFRISPTSGLGPRLLRLAQSSTPTTPVLLDGPYGGLVNRDFGRHETIVLIAGGAGVTFVSAVLEEMCGRVLREEEGVRGVRRIEVHWAVRREEAKTWIDDHLSQALQHVLERKKGLVSLNLYVTGEDDSAPSTPTASTTTTALAYDEGKIEECGSGGGGCGGSGSEKKSASVSSIPSSLPWTLHHTRPCIPSLLSSIFSSVPSGSTVAVGSCGPDSLTTAVRRSVAKRQRAIMLGRVEGGAQEVELHTEEFAW